MTATLKIDIIIDTVCPWCFIGKRRLEKAMAAFGSTHPDVAFDVAWHPFQLNPHLGSPKSKLEHYEAKFGNERTKTIIPYIKAVGAAEGIAFDYGGLIGNSLGSHRLIAWAAAQFGNQASTGLVEELFKDYFERRQNIADHDVLAAAAERAGLDKEKALAYLNSNDGIDTIRQEAEKNQVACQGGVPNYKIQNRFNISGAQEPNAFVAYFEKAVKEQQSSF